MDDEDALVVDVKMEAEWAEEVGVGVSVVLEEEEVWLLELGDNEGNNVRVVRTVREEVTMTRSVTVPTGVADDRGVDDDELKSVLLLVVTCGVVWVCICESLDIGVSVEVVVLDRMAGVDSVVRDVLLELFDKVVVGS